MNRFLSGLRRAATCIAFFALLVYIWHVLVQRGAWSAILLPDPSDVWIYLVGAVKDGTLLSASIVTMRRLLIGYGIGIVIGIPLGLLTARFKIFSDTIGVLALGLQDPPQRLLGSAGPALVRSNRSRHALCRRDGLALVQWSLPPTTASGMSPPFSPAPRAPLARLRPHPHTSYGHAPRIASLHRQAA